MKTKDKVKYWLDKYPSLRDDDNRLSANIWSEELIEKGFEVSQFLVVYACSKLTSAPSIFINLAAITDVDFCETNKEIAYKINTEFPALISRTLKFNKKRYYIS